MAWYQRFRNVFRWRRLDDDLEIELQFHLAETVDRLVAAGMPEKQAVREAQLRLGNYTLQKERTRDMNISAWLDSTRADVVYAMRQLRANPGFATIAVLSLGLGIGANSAIFQLVNAIYLKMLPVQNPRELVSMDFEKGSSRSGRWTSRNARFTYVQWDQIRMQQQAFSGVLAWSDTRFNLAHGGEPRFAEGLYVSGDFFQVLGVNAILGRTLIDADDKPVACAAGAVLSHAFWKREFGGDPGVLGRTISLDGYTVPVVGVTGPLFFGVEVGSRFDVAIPLCADRLLAEDKKGRIPPPSTWWLSIMGRLKPGWTEKSANAHLHTLSPAIMQAALPPEYPAPAAKRFLANKLSATEAGTGLSNLRRQYERPLWILMTTTGLVLLIACANLANLLLARATAREREIAIRLAIGASRWRLVRQLLAESLLLSSAGALLGAGIAIVLSRALVLFISTPNNPVFVDVAPDSRALIFTASLAVLTCLLFGLLPALRATFQAPSSAMRSGGPGVTAGRERHSIRRVLVVTQVALSLVLLVGTLLFVRSLHNLLTVDAGFRAEGVLAVNVNFNKASLPEERRQDVYRELSEKFSALPGVVSAAQVDSTPVSGSAWDQSVGLDGARAEDSGKRAFFNRAGPNYFRTMGTRIIAGRDFDPHDTVNAPGVAIVNQVFARKYFGDVNPVGHTFHLDALKGQPEPLFQIVGMVENTKYHDLREDFVPIAFFSIAQNAQPDSEPTFVVRVAGSPEQLKRSARAVVAGMGSSIGIEFRTLSAQLNESLLREKLMAVLSGGFGLLAGLLSTLGLYGVLAYMMARRRSEIGVRMALGANRGQVIWFVFREAVRLLAIGLAVGVVLALAAGRAASTLLFGLAPHDWISLTSATLVLTMVGLAASYLPARQAAAIDPNTTLRNE